MSLLTSQISLNSATLATSSTSFSSNPLHPMMIFICQKGKSIDLLRLKNTGGKWTQYFNTHIKQRLVRHNIKSNGKHALLSTRNGSLQQTWMKTISSNSGNMVGKLPPSQQERPTTPYTTVSADEQPLT